MDQEVARTLTELEHKLRELEFELASIGHRQGAPVTPSSPSSPSSASPPSPSSASPPFEPSSPPPPPAPAPALGSQQPPPPPPPLSSPPPPLPHELVDEAIDRRFSLEAQETVYGEIPATRDEHETIDLGELVRFRDTMQRTLQLLIDEYSRLLSLRPPSDG